jgi:membrane associated rhomboid family serine protease
MTTKPIMKIEYNSPIILTFSLAAVVIRLLNTVFPDTLYFFAMVGRMSFSNPLTYFRLISYVLGHANWEHLLGNLAFILLLGPILEEKYGSVPILIMMGLTAFFSGLISILLFRTGGLGASGIVFMLILLASIVDVKEGTIPLTFVLVAAIFIGREIVNSLRPDNISQLGHIIGGAFGAFFGFMLIRPLKEKNLSSKKPPINRL